MQKMIKLTLICCLSTSLHAADTVTANEVLGLPTIGQTANAVAQIQNIPTKGKVLECEQMKFLNTIFKGAPIGLVHFKMAANAARNILAVLPQSPDDPKTMAMFVKKLVKPLEPFLDRIKGFADTLTPLIKQSLNAEPPAYLIGFVGSKDETKDGDSASAAYFQQALKTKVELERACKEFMQFYLDIYASITPDTREGFDQLWRQIVAEQKRAAQSK